MGCFISFKIVGKRIAAQHFRRADEMNLVRLEESFDFRKFEAKNRDDLRRGENFRFRSTDFTKNKRFTARPYNRNCVRFNRYFRSSFVCHYSFFQIGIYCLQHSFLLLCGC